MGRGAQQSTTTGGFSPLYGRHPQRKAKREPTVTSTVGWADFCLLCALERAGRSDGTPPDAWNVQQQLRSDTRRLTTREVANRMRALEKTGWVTRIRTYGTPLRYQLTDAGARELNRRGD